jgi:hypothetical protein
LRALRETVGNRRSGCGKRVEQAIRHGASLGFGSFQRFCLLVFVPFLELGPQNSWNAAPTDAGTAGLAANAMRRPKACVRVVCALVCALGSGSGGELCGNGTAASRAKQQSLYFLPLPHGQGALRLIELTNCLSVANPRIPILSRQERDTEGHASTGTTRHRSAN